MARLISSAIKFYIAGDAYPTIMTSLRHCDNHFKIISISLDEDFYKAMVLFEMEK